MIVAAAGVERLPRYSQSADVIIRQSTEDSYFDAVSATAKLSGPKLRGR